jgi:hypothetical protein
MLELNTKQYEITNKDISQRDFVQDYLNRTLTMFSYKGLPDSIPEIDLELILQLQGYGIITEHEGELVALWGSFAPPCDIYYRPENVLVNNPWAKINKTYKVKDNTDAVLIRNDPLQRGLLPIFNRYGSLMTEAQITYLRALINFRAMFVFTGDDDADKKSAEIFLQKIEAGEGGTMVTGGFENGIQAQPLLAQASNYITQAIEAQQYVLGMLYQQIGIQSTFNMKRERQTENETNLDTDPLRPLIDAMLEERQRALEAVNEKYGTNITVEFNGLWSKYNGNNSIEGDSSIIDVTDNSNNGDVVTDGLTEEQPTEETPTEEAPVVEVNIEVNEGKTEEEKTEEEPEESEEKDDGEAKERNAEDDN